MFQFFEAISVSRSLVSLELRHISTNKDTHKQTTYSYAHIIIESLFRTKITFLLDVLRKTPITIITFSIHLTNKEHSI